MIRAGPIGEANPSVYGYTQWDEKGNTMISHLFVSFSGYNIISIQFGYNQNGTLVMSTKYGGPSEGESFRIVKLKHNEYVTGLSGLLREFGGINSLTFYTNLGKHGPICEPVTKSTSIKDNKRERELDLAICDHREFGGFFGSYDRNYLRSIGMYVSPSPNSNTAVKREYVQLLVPFNSIVVGSFIF